MFASLLAVAADDAGIEIGIGPAPPAPSSTRASAACMKRPLPFFLGSGASRSRSCHRLSMIQSSLFEDAGQAKMPPSDLRSPEACALRRGVGVARGHCGRGFAAGAAFAGGIAVVAGGACGELLPASSRRSPRKLASPAVRCVGGHGGVDRRHEARIVVGECHREAAIVLSETQRDLPEIGMVHGEIGRGRTDCFASFDEAVDQRCEIVRANRLLRRSRAGSRRGCRRKRRGIDNRGRGAGGDCQRAGKRSGLLDNAGRTWRA